MVTGALAELHLDTGCPHRLRELGELAGELIAARFEERKNLISFQGGLQGAGTGTCAANTSRYQLALETIRLRGAELGSSREEQRQSRGAADRECCFGWG